MDVKLLESCCESYIITNNLYETYTTEQLFKDAYKTLYFMRKFHIEESNKFEDYDSVNKALFLNEYFDLTYKEDLINEFVESVMTVFLVTIGFKFLYKCFNTQITSIVAPMFNKISEHLYDLGKFLTKGRYWKFQYAIIQKNLKQSYVKCDIDIKDIDFKFYSAIKDSDKKATADVSKKAKCLRDKYLKIHITQIGLLLKSYFICLKRTGNFKQVENVDPKELMVILQKTKLSNSCLEYYEIVKQTLEDFDYMLNAFVDKKDHLIYYNDLFKEISSVKKEIQRTTNFKKYK